MRTILLMTWRAAATLSALASASPGSAQTLDLDRATLVEVQAAMDAGVLTSEALVKRCLDRIAAYDRSGPAIRALLAVHPEPLAAARALDDERKRRGARSLLHGIPVIVKDNIDTFDLPTTGGSLALEGSAPPDDAFVVQRLRRAGAILLAKANMDELARDTIGLSSLGGQTRNPYDLQRSPGGSSGGTAAAVAAHFGTVGLGTETGVSVRDPSADNNVVGLVPTEGLVSRDGVIPVSFTQDRVGPIARSVVDAAVVLDIIAGLDLADLTTSRSLGRRPDGGYAASLEDAAPEGARPRIGVLRDMFRSGPDHDKALRSIEAALEALEGSGTVVIDPVTTRLDLLALLEDARLNQFEFAQALDHYLESRGPDVPVESARELIASGKSPPRLERILVSSANHASFESDPEYLERLDRRHRLRETLTRLMDTHELDVLVYPMKTIPARAIGEHPPESDNALSSCTGFPAVVVPAGFTDEGLPVALEFLGRPFDEVKILAAAHAFEKATGHRRMPPSTPPLPERR